MVIVALARKNNLKIKVMKKFGIIIAGVLIIGFISLSFVSSPARDQLFSKIRELKLENSSYEIRLGAYRKIKTMKEFQKRFPCIKNENIRVYITLEGGNKSLNKYAIQEQYPDLNDALNKLHEIKQRGCFSEKDPPFINLLYTEKSYTIFCDNEGGQEVIWIKSDGQEIWRSR